MKIESEAWIFKLDPKVLVDKQAFVNDTWIQWVKDVHSCGLEISTQAPISSAQCYDFIKEWISNLGPEKLKQILYRVDVPEMLTGANKLNENYYKNLTDLIIHREAMKVFFRKYHTF